MTREDPKLYDVRTLERNLRKGLISKKDYERFLKALIDRADNAAVSRPQEGPEPEPDGDPHHDGANNVGA